MINKSLLVNVNSTNNTSYQTTYNDSICFLPNTNQIYHAGIHYGGPEIKGWKDTRGTDTIPNDYNSKFKINGIKNITMYNSGENEQLFYGNGSFITTFGLRGYENWSGGNAWEFGLGDNNIFVRNGSQTTWNKWKKLAFIDDVPKDALKWDKQNLGLNVIDTAITQSNNILAFANPDGIQIMRRDSAYVKDWTLCDYISNSEKTKLISGIGSNIIQSLPYNTQYAVGNQLLVILNASLLGIYAQTKRLYINFSSNGALYISCAVYYLTYQSDEWVYQYTQRVSGWSEWNCLEIDTRFGKSGTTLYTKKIILIFELKDADPRYSNNFNILDLYLVANHTWTYPSTIARTGHLYTYDSSANVGFLSNVTANGLITGYDSAKIYGGLNVWDGMELNGLLSAHSNAKFDGFVSCANGLEVASHTDLCDVSISGILEVNNDISIGAGKNLHINSGRITGNATSLCVSTNMGLMSVDDKQKLDGIANGANYYALPNATTIGKGGVIVGNGLSVSSAKISVTYPLSSTTSNWLSAIYPMMCYEDNNPKIGNNNYVKIYDKSNEALAGLYVTGNAYIDHKLIANDISILNSFHAYGKTHLYDNVICDANMQIKELDVCTHLTAYDDVSILKKLLVNGDTSINGFLDVSADIFSNGAITQASDIRLKDIVDDNVVLSLDTLINAPCIEYTWKNKDNTLKHIGTIAQYWEDKLPSVVYSNIIDSSTNEKYLSIDYGALSHAEVVSLAKLLTKEIADLKSRIKLLEDTVL